ncbi:uncharacterized protein LOC130803524 isoform X4 [Amaranthus tricolor]|uniref:uncharacterized protein LOC130803524 isoform X4 n=1 Tax=Amaranthus tricolor TaxID=29722 RepID=UPI0025826DE2|nr:uncharacterized protein LOC130803524 isoform X4 [Amaranthus tricolor]XP_057523655.1 uncharacterized protein LOC130803524 isoform X4 [Amaranthus tricolor]
MSFKGTQQKCKVCDKTVCLMDQLSADGVAYHKSCFNVITAKASFSSKRKATSTPSVSTIPSVSNYNYELNYPEGYDQGLHDYAKEVEREIHIEDEEEEPTTPIGILRSRQSSTESHEVQQQQQRQARGKQVNFQSIDEDEPIRNLFRQCHLLVVELFHMCGHILQNNQLIIRMFSYALVKFVKVKG